MVVADANSSQAADCLIDLKVLAVADHAVAMHLLLLQLPRLADALLDQLLAVVADANSFQAADCLIDLKVLAVDHAVAMLLLL